MDTPLQVTDITPSDEVQAVDHVVLVVVNVQGRDLANKAVTLVNEFRAKRQPVVFVQEAGEPLLAGLEPRPEEYLIRKRRYSAFFGTELDIVLRGYQARTIILIGGMTDVCIHYTAADAHQHDYRIRAVPELCAGSSLKAHNAALRAMKYLQRDALVTSSAVSEWLSTAPAPASSPAIAALAEGSRRN